MSAAIRAWVSEMSSGKRSCLENTGEPFFDFPLLEPPDAVLVGRAGDGVGLAVVVHVVGNNVGHGVAQGWRDGRSRACWRSGPNAGCSHQPPVQITSCTAVAIQVAHAQSMREPEVPGSPCRGCWAR